MCDRRHRDFMSPTESMNFVGMRCAVEEKKDGIPRRRRFKLRSTKSGETFVVIDGRMTPVVICMEDELIGVKV